jgi:hypothetical protein
MIVLFTVPSVGVIVTFKPYPPEELSDTSKPAGAVAVRSPVRLLPETVNCAMLGLVDGDPGHDAICPMGVLAVSPGVFASVLTPNGGRVPVRMGFIALPLLCLVPDTAIVLLIL